MNKIIVTERLGNGSHGVDQYGHSIALDMSGNWVHVKGRAATFHRVSRTVARILLARDRRTHPRQQAWPTVERVWVQAERIALRVVSEPGPA